METFVVTVLIYTSLKFANTWKDLEHIRELDDLIQKKNDK